MRRLALLSVLALGVAACGGSGAPSTPVKITLGYSGGTMVGWSVTIAPGGAVTPSSTPGGRPMPITSAKDAELSGLVRSAFGKLKSQDCPGSFPDMSSRFITALGKTVTLRGNCDPDFMKLWDALTHAIGLYGPTGG